MPFQKGNTLGRLTTGPRKQTIEYQEFCRQLIEDPDYRAQLRDDLLNNKRPRLEPLIWQYAYGKPKETVEKTVKQFVFIGFWDGDKWGAEPIPAQVSVPQLSAAADSGVQGSRAEAGTDVLAPEKW